GHGRDTDKPTLHFLTSRIEDTGEEERTPRETCVGCGGRAIRWILAASIPRTTLLLATHAIRNLLCRKRGGLDRRRYFSSPFFVLLYFWCFCWREIGDSVKILKGFSCFTWV
ncbi:unnamed protein product, partial [Ectocarpus sp. 8 AP-2014]